VANEEDDQAAGQAFSSQLLASQERERERIARELHDSLGQNLLVIKNLAFLGAKHSEASAESKEKFQDISSIATRTIKEVRLISYGLRPDELDHIGLTKSLIAIVNQVADSGTTRFEAAIDDIDALLAPDLEINLYRVVQEGLNNILKHSQASCARVTLRKMEHAICLTIRDNGQGFDHSDGHRQTSFGHGFGMTSMHERIRILGGQLRVNSKRGQGTTIEARIPIAKPSEAMPARPDSALAEAGRPKPCDPAKDNGRAPVPNRPRSALPHFSLPDDYRV
jgi:signal transduction histidine kinase